MPPGAGLRKVVAVVVACAALTACGSHDGGASGGTEPVHGGHLAGLHWRLEGVDGPAGATRLPARVDGWLEVGDHGHTAGSDGCATFQATSHRSATTLVLTDISTTANGCVGDHGPRDLARLAVARVLLSGHVATLARNGHRLQVRDARYALTYVSTGPARSTGG